MKHVTGASSRKEIGGAHGSRLHSALLGWFYSSGPTRASTEEVEKPR
jgi:hypothetical protein